MPRCGRRRLDGVRVRRMRQRSRSFPPLKRIERRCSRSAHKGPSWHPKTLSSVVREEVFYLPAPRRARGHEQRGSRFAVIVQVNEFIGLSTVLVSPTFTAARPASFRPVITLDGTPTSVLVEQTAVVDPECLGVRQDGSTRASCGRSIVPSLSSSGHS